MRLLLIFLIAINFMAATASAAQKPIALQQSLVLKKDSTAIHPRKFSEDAIRDYSQQKEFKYDDVAPPNQSWFANLMGRFWKWLDRLFSGKTSGSIIKYLLIGVAIAIVTFVIIKLVGIDFKLIAGKSKTTDIPYEESLENIHEINFDDQIEKALQDKNYRLVVRLLYLKTLKQLSDKGLILWQPEKTNQAYVLELPLAHHQAAFAELTNQFEYIWYGEFFIDQAHFQSINQSFIQFNQQTA